MDGIFSRNLNETKFMDKEKVKENIESFLKGKHESCFSADYFDVYDQLKNPQINFFTKTLLDEINYQNIKGSDFFGAFRNTEKKIDYLQQTQAPNVYKKNSLEFGIPSLNKNVEINKNKNFSLYKNYENEMNRYLSFYPDSSVENENKDFSFAKISKPLKLINNNTDMNSKYHQSTINKFDNYLLIDDDFLPLNENDNIKIITNKGN